MKKLVIMFAILCLLITGVSAVETSLGTFKQYEPVTLRQMCASCSYNNITSVISPNGTVLVSNVEMSGTVEYTYLINSLNTSEIGIYYVNGYGDLLGTDTAWVYTFEITPNGFVNSVSFYIIILLLSLGLVVFGLSIRDAPITILGSLGLYFVGLYVLFFGIVGVKDPVYTWAIGIITLGIAFYVSTRSSYELISSTEL